VGVVFVLSLFQYERDTHALVILNFHTITQRTYKECFFENTKQSKYMKHNEIIFLTRNTLQNEIRESDPLKSVY
ncbi:MAG: hypothetical protein LBQ66_09910, partial [Planctomycetaceae bacterium]|jgi:hypothetical protein|nr:hypothetical protein [Planctomycetaceae bacterium]